MDDLLDRVLAAKEDDACFTQLVEDHKSWILSCASKAAGRYVTDSDDEWSVALMAFSEAVRSYDAQKGAFRPLASVVIRRRVTDHLRSEGRHSAELTVTPGAFAGELEEEEACGVNLRVASRVAQDSMGAAFDDSVSRAREEIAEMQDILRAYGFSFFDLAECSPKAEKTKKSCAQAIRTLIASAILMAKLRLKRLLPIRELSEQSGVIRKILDRHRRYIIAGAEILDGDFPILASYLKSVREG
ncbi:MAG: RNA polymerase subunit sigma [Oscillospiraceae bacterium]|nr:RNA polymerase subunit sigma [Oscillospiraceae bacterium]